MSIQVCYAPNKVDLSLLAIKAAEELERSKNSLATDFKSVIKLSEILKESFLKETGDSNYKYRLDHASVFSKALTNSNWYTPPVKKTVSELADDARTIALLLDTNKDNSKKADLNRLISFCVALSDSAALYKAELEDLKRHLG